MLLRRGKRRTRCLLVRGGYCSLEGDIVREEGIVQPGGGGGEVSTEDVRLISMESVLYVEEELW